MHILLGLIIGFIFAIWVNSVAKRVGKDPLRWIICTVLVWPVGTLAAGWRFRNLGLTVVGSIGCTYLYIVAMFFTSLAKNDAITVLMRLGPFYCLWLFALVQAFRTPHMTRRTRGSVVVASVISLALLVYGHIEQLNISRANREIGLSYPAFSLDYVIGAAFTCLSSLALGLLLYVIFDREHTSTATQTEVKPNQPLQATAAAPARCD